MMKGWIARAGAHEPRMASSASRKVPGDEATMSTESESLRNRMEAQSKSRRMKRELHEAESRCWSMRRAAGRENAEERVLPSRSLCDRAQHGGIIFLPTTTIIHCSSPYALAREHLCSTASYAGRTPSIKAMPSCLLSKTMIACGAHCPDTAPVYDQSDSPQRA
jgi:hypothetical protein